MGYELNMSQIKSVFIGENEKNDTNSEAALSDFHIDSTKSNVNCLESRKLASTQRFHQVLSLRAVILTVK
jgi:hypothetical protein